MPTDLHATHPDVLKMHDPSHPRTPTPTGVATRHPAQTMTLREYVLRRSGTPLGGAGSLRAMLTRSFGARSFADFWRHWNPLWGYGLGRFVYAPVRRRASAAVAVMATFIVSGAVHDAVATIVRRSFTLVATPWFLLLGIGVLVASATSMDLSRRPWWVRAAVNAGYLAGCLAATVYATTIFGPGGST